MSGSIETIRNALYDTVDAINVSAILPGGWTFKKKHAIKQPPGYPGYFVTPARNTAPVTLDTASQDAPYTFWIYLIHSYDNPSTAEDQLIKLADVVFTALLEKLRGETLLPGVDFDSDISGEWFYDQENGERFYRMEVTARTTQTI